MDENIFSQWINNLDFEFWSTGQHKVDPHAFFEKWAGGEAILLDVPDFRSRLGVKAGITGLAQIMGNYSLEPADKFRYDMIYIQKGNLLLDLQIMLMTKKILFLKGKTE